MINKALLYLKGGHLRSCRSDSHETDLCSTESMDPGDALAALTIMKAAFTQVQVLAEQLCKTNESAPSQLT